MSTGIVVFAWSLKRGGANKRLAEYARRLSLITDKSPIFTQREYIELPEKFDVSYVTESWQNPAPTLRIAREAILWAKQRRLQQLWVIAARPHIRRCVRDLRFAARDADFKITIRVKNTYGTYGSWFSADAGQSHTTSRVVWHLRETAIMIFPWLYRRKAK